MGSLGVPREGIGGEAIGGEGRYPRLDTQSNGRVVSSRRSAVPSQSRVASPRISSIRWANFLRVAASAISASSAISCCLRIAANCSDDFAPSPASEKVAASIRRFGTPLIADTTTTTESSRAAVAQICAVRAMQEASPTEVPPNFMTTSLDFILDRADDANREFD